MSNISFLSYFNPFANHHAIERLFDKDQNTSTLKKVFICTASIFTGLFTLGFGGVALFRFLVDRCSTTPPENHKETTFNTQTAANRAFKIKEETSLLDRKLETPQAPNYERLAGKPLASNKDHDDPKGLILFYQGGHKNKNGFTLEEILAFDDRQMEDHHDFIQWIFPTKHNGVNPKAPQLHPRLIQKASANSIFKVNVLRSFHKMLSYYGLETQGSDVVKSSNFNERKQYWHINGSHNLKRMTRIIESMKLLGFKEESTAFGSCILNIARNKEVRINKTTQKFWIDAMKA